MNELKICPNCKNVLEIHVKTLNYWCPICGYSENKESDKKEIDYVG